MRVSVVWVCRVYVYRQCATAEVESCNPNIKIYFDFIIVVMRLLLFCTEKSDNLPSVALLAPDLRAEYWWGQ